MSSNRTQHIDALAERLLSIEADGMTRAERVMHANIVAESYINTRNDNDDDTWPADVEPPSVYELFAAIVQRDYPALLDHALVWADYQIELHQAAPGDCWQILSQSPDGWQANRIGTRAAALVGYEFELALRGVAAHLMREGHDTEKLDMQVAFDAINDAINDDDTESPDNMTARHMARVALRGLGLGRYIY